MVNLDGKIINIWKNSGSTNNFLSDYVKIWLIEIEIFVVHFYVCRHELGFRSTANADIFIAMATCWTIAVGNSFPVWTPIKPFNSS